jgi:hypothetical protein
VTQDRPVDARLPRGFYVSAIPTTSGCDLNGIDTLKFSKCKQSSHHTVVTKMSNKNSAQGIRFEINKIFKGVLHYVKIKEEAGPIL